jgi:hypothetical protein
MAHGWHLEAEFESGYVHVEGPQDLSPYAPGRNTFYDLMSGEPTKHGHGRMTRFSIVCDIPDEDGMATRYDVDWTVLPDSAKPIHYMEMQRSITVGGPDGEEFDTGPICVRRGFGFTYTDPDTGEEVTKVEEIEG